MILQREVVISNLSSLYPGTPESVLEVLADSYLEECRNPYKGLGKRKCPDKVSKFIGVNVEFVLTEGTPENELGLEKNCYGFSDVFVSGKEPVLFLNAKETNQYKVRESY